MSVFSTFASEFKTQIRMDKDDFTFIVTSFCYLILSLVCRIGYLDMAVLDVASIVLWGMLLITTIIKARFCLKHSGHTLAAVAIVVAIIVFLLSIIIPIINPLIY